MVDVRTLHNLSFQPLDVIHLDPEVGSHTGRTLHPFRITQQQGVFSVISVKSCQRNLSVFCLGSHGAGVIKSKRIGNSGRFFCHGYGPWAAMLQQFPVGNIRMAYGPVRKKASVLSHSGCLDQQSRNGSVNIRFTDNGISFLIQQSVGGAGHNTDLGLKLVPALDRASPASVFFQKIFNRYFKRGDIFKLLILNLHFHMRTAIFHNPGHPVFFFFYLFHLVRQLRHGYGGKLNIKFFKQLSFITHG